MLVRKIKEKTILRRESLMYKGSVMDLEAGMGLAGMQGKEGMRTHRSPRAKFRNIGFTLKGMQW